MSASEPNNARKYPTLQLHCGRSSATQWRQPPSRVLDGHVVDFAARAVLAGPSTVIKQQSTSTTHVDDEVELGRVDEDQVVHREARRRDDADEARSDTCPSATALRGRRMRCAHPALRAW